VIPDDKLEAEVEQWCEEILSLSPSALEAVKLHFQADSEHIQGFSGTWAARQSVGT
jgi:2-ketocyclohexanecarboxyl-CoA hydrolase